MKTLYRSLVESMVNGVVTITTDGSIVDANFAFSEMMEISHENLPGKSFFEFIRLGWNQRFFEFLHDTEAKVRMVEVSLTSRSGKEIPVRLATVKPGVTGQSDGISLTITDLTAQNLTEETLRRTEQRLTTVAELTSDAVWELDGSTKEIWRSEGFAELLGYPSDDAIKPITLWWQKQIHPEDRSRVISELERVIESGKGEFKKSYRLKRFDGTYAEVVHHAIAIRDKKTKIFRVIGSIVDVTQKNKSANEKRDVSKKIMDAQEQERKRVARDLHDGVSQLLAASLFRLHAVQTQVAKADGLLAKKIAEAQKLLEKAHLEVQLISRNLRPSELDDLGLGAALRSLCADFKKRTGIKTSVDTELSAKILDANAELTIYRIVQEALNNIEKHSRAKNVRLTLFRNGNDILVKVSDDGKGFDQKKARKKSSCGLDNMRERASFLNGSVTCLSNPSKGTTVTLVLPVS